MEIRTSWLRAQFPFQQLWLSSVRLAVLPYLESALDICGLIAFILCWLPHGFTRRPDSDRCCWTVSSRARLHDSIGKNASLSGPAHSLYGFRRGAPRYGIARHLRPGVGNGRREQHGNW